MKTKLKKGQTVKLLIGVDKGKTGEIIKLFPKNYTALIKGINVKKKHQKPTKEQKGGLVNIEKPVHLSNLILFYGKKDAKVLKKKEVKKVKEKNNPIKKKIINKKIIKGKK